MVGPGSIVNGVKYELVRDVPPAALPPALAALADGKPHREPRKGKLELLVELDLAENKDFAIGYLKTKAPEAIEGAGAVIWPHCQLPTVSAILASHNVSA